MKVPQISSPYYNNAYWQDTTYNRHNSANVWGLLFQLIHPLFPRLLSTPSHFSNPLNTCKYYVVLVAHSSPLAGSAVRIVGITPRVQHSHCSQRTYSLWWPLCFCLDSDTAWPVRGIDLCKVLCKINSTLMMTHMMACSVESAGMHEGSVLLSVFSHWLFWWHAS